jgi:hypothetical protein
VLPKNITRQLCAIQQAVQGQPWPATSKRLLQHSENEVSPDLPASISSSKLPKQDPKPPDVSENFSAVQEASVAQMQHCVVTPALFPLPDPWVPAWAFGLHLTPDPYPSPRTK